MAEVKNAFIKSKMNKDLDDRLLPNGEYRDALNVQISKSDASDVGALENVVGNSLVKNFALLFAQTKINSNAGSGFTFTLNNVTSLKIGMIVSATGVIKGTKITNITGNNITLDKTATLAGGAALVFVLDLKCIGYFVDEFNNDIYSFFTDFTDNSGGTVPDYSITADNFIFKHNIPTNDTRVLVRGAFLNFSTTSPIIGVNLLEELLFFTDNRNQPRKINVTSANTTAGNLTPTYYVNEDQISVAKYNPYEVINVITTSALTAAEVKTTTLNGASSTEVLIVDSATNISIGNGVKGAGVKTNTFVVSINGLNITTNKKQSLADGVTLIFSGLETSMYDVSSVKLPDGTTDNPYREADFGGDPDFLEDKFVRFSYRFQFDDGENSIFAPFTQPCFIPKQDGYFIDDDEKQAFSSTVVEFMENKVTKIQLQIPLPAEALALVSSVSPYKIKAIDILYKESDGLAVQVVDTIPVDTAFGVSAGSNNVYQYAYESTKPFKTLPSKELIRVYDKIPVKAFSQEIISNRVVYGNFQDKHTPPAALDYQVAVFDKYAKNSPFSNKTIIEYPNSTVKQNRNYQVGIVLSDKFGRQSSTILSNNTTALTDGLFGASTVFSPYQKTTDTTPSAWPGDSLKILFNEAITSQVNSITGTPGLYNSDASSVNYNPLGWYSYKVVVQQKEQDYYNVYNAGAMKGNPLDVTQDLKTSYISLLNDNINKVPRDLSEVGPLQKQFRSSVRLIGRVENTQYATVAVGNKQFYPGRLTDTTSSIEDLNSLFDVSSVFDASSPPVAIPITTNTNPYFPFYKAESDPLIAQITTTSPFGLPNTASGTTYAPIENLTIFETEPDLSRLDFYFETSTTGLISELNLAIDTDTGGAFNINNFILQQTEATDINTNVTGLFFPTDITDAIIVDSEVLSFTITDGAGVSRTGDWTITETGNGTVGDPHKYQLKSAAYQYYGPGANVNQSYSFAFLIKDNTVTPPVERTLTTAGQLGNVSPTITLGTTQLINIVGGTTGAISTQTAVNGAILAGGSSTLNLDWNKVSGDNNFTINPSTGVISNSLITAAGSYTVVIKVTDAGGEIQEATLTIVFGNAPVPSRFIIPEATFRDGEMITYYFTDPTTNSFSALDNANHVINVGTNGDEFRQSNAQGTTPTAASNSTQTFVCTNPSDKYLSKKQYKGDWFEGDNNAAFYVAIKTQNNGSTSPSLATTTTRTAASVEWRNVDRGTDWTQAYDINGQKAKFGMVLTNPTSETFAQARYNINGQLTTKPISFGSPGYPGVQTDCQYDVTNPPSIAFTTGYRIFAFDGGSDNSADVDGEYRITLGNFSGTDLSYPSCTDTPNDSVAFQTIELGDASYGGPNGISAYTYKVSNQVSGDATCATSMDGTYYAREWITKYVTQLYTDQDMLIKAVFDAEEIRRFRRDGENQEGTVDGSYLAPFNTAGLRAKTTASASKACVLST